MRQIEYQARNCDCCDNHSLEPVWNYARTCKTRNNHFQWTVNNVICTQCGFAFVSPVPTDQSLALYYGDSFSIYANQAIDYSINKRLNVIESCQAKIQATRYLEIGSNNSPEFIQKLSNVIPHIETVELNEDCDSTYNTLTDVPHNSQEIIAPYFVLEHLPNPRAFLDICHQLLISLLLTDIQLSKTTTIFDADPRKSNYYPRFRFTYLWQLPIKSSKPIYSSSIPTGMLQPLTTGFSRIPEENRLKTTLLF